MNPVASDNDQQLPLGLERGTSMHELMELDPSSTSFSFENEDIMMWEPSGELDVQYFSANIRQLSASG